MDLVVAYDLFFSDTARRVADVVLPGTAWLEELGCKSTNTHLYLMPQVLEAPGEARPVVWVLRELAQRLGVTDFFPWADERGPIEAWLRSVILGHLQYYGVPMNWRALFTFCGQVERLWYRVLARRSQRGRVAWSRMQRLRGRWLPAPRLFHPYPLQRFGVRT
jgi:anaerobic selenocysteine-containing dehydrogenase